jgi:hypothetical protein
LNTKNTTTYTDRITCHGIGQKAKCGKSLFPNLHGLIKYPVNLLLTFILKCVYIYLLNGYILCMFQAMTWISNAMSFSDLCHWLELKCYVLVPSYWASISCIGPRRCLGPVQLTSTQYDCLEHNTGFIWKYSFNNTVILTFY